MWHKTLAALFDLCDRSTPRRRGPIRRRYRKAKRGKSHSPGLHPTFENGISFVKISCSGKPGTNDTIYYVYIYNALNRLTHHQEGQWEQTGLGCSASYAQRHGTLTVQNNKCLQRIDLTFKPFLLSSCLPVFPSFLSLPFLFSSLLLFLFLCCFSFLFFSCLACLFSFFAWISKHLHLHIWPFLGAHTHPRSAFVTSNLVCSAFVCWI